MIKFTKTIILDDADNSCTSWQQIEICYHYYINDTQFYKLKYITRVYGYDIDGDDIKSYKDLIQLQKDYIQEFTLDEAKEQHIATITAYNKEIQDRQDRLGNYWA